MLPINFSNMDAVIPYNVVFYENADAKDVILLDRIDAI